MGDPYANLRAALAAGPTPGPWQRSEHATEFVIGGSERRRIVAQARATAADAAFITACDPDTIGRLIPPEAPDA